MHKRVRPGLAQLADSAALGLKPVRGPSQAFWALCYIQQAGLCRLPLGSQLFFLSNFLC